MCSGSEAGSYLRLIDFVYHSTLGLRVKKKKKKETCTEEVQAKSLQLQFPLRTRHTLEPMAPTPSQWLQRVPSCLFSLPHPLGVPRTPLDLAEP